MFEREIFGNKSVDVGMRIIRFESFEEGPIAHLHAYEIVREREREKRERKRLGNKAIYVGIRVIRFESFEESWKTPKVRPPHIPRRERILCFPQPSNIIPLIESPEKPKHKDIATQQN